MSQYTSYYLYQKYVSYDNGSTWVPVYPEEYSISGDSSDPQTITKKQDNDPECGYTPPVVLQYRWVEDGDNYICDDCGYTPTPQYRTISGTPYCTGYDKMVDTQYQVSYDSGSTWSTVSSSTLTVEHNSQDCGYVPPTPTDYSTQYLTFRALEDGTFSFTKSGMSYSLDSGSTWNTLSASANTPTINSGQTVMWKATLIASGYNGIGRFISSGLFEAEGNVMSLKYGDNFSGQTTLTDDYAFASLFSNYDSEVLWFSKLASAENLVLPATSLTTSCYSNMFMQCTSLTTAPALPATSLELYCYGHMFQGCTSLTTAPALPATALSYSCYNGMFYGCTSLTTAPVLSATTLAPYCYAYMFENCTNLSSITCLATDISAMDSTNSWVDGVSPSGTFYKNPSMSSWTTGNDGIPSGWTVQDYQG